LKAIVLSPGPSLARYVPQPADLIVAVNRAGLVHHCDYWAALDYCMIRDFGPQVIGTPHLFTRQTTYIDTRGMTERFKEVRLLESCKLRSPKFRTMHAAISFAYDMGATEIRVFGADWSGTKDFDGSEAGEDRTESRWADEQQVYCDLVNELAKRDVTVTR
jgi:hypothetical protein